MTRQVAATVDGDGPAVLLLHGQPGTAADWEGVRRELEGRYRVIVPDRPGYGNTGGPPLGMVGNADAMIGLLDELGEKEVTVAGHSWGAGVALAMAQLAPDRVKRLVLVCPVTPADRLGLTDRLLAEPRVGAAATRAGFWATGMALSTRRAQERLRRTLPGLSPSRIAEIARMWRRGKVWRSFHHEQRALFDELPQLRDGLTSLAAATTVVIGLQDRITDPRAGRMFAASIGARLIEVPRAGHLLPMQAPHEVAEAIASA